MTQITLSTATVERPIVSDVFPEGIVNSTRPPVGALLRRKVQAGSLQILVDGYDCTDSSRLYEDRISWSPPGALRPGLHHVKVFAVDDRGTPIEVEWSFLVEDANVRHASSENERFCLIVWTHGVDLSHHENHNSNFFFER